MALLNEHIKVRQQELEKYKLIQKQSEGKVPWDKDLLNKVKVIEAMGRLNALLSLDAGEIL